MIEVEEQSFAAIQESKAEEIVVDECRHGSNHNVEDAEADSTLGDEHLGAEGRIAVHVIDVIGEGGVGVVDDSRALRVVTA